MIDDGDTGLFNRAVRLYQRECEAEGEIFQIPSAVDSDIASKRYRIRLVMLRNLNGQLAGYEYNPSTNRLKRVD
jgi:hypothetical protein